MVTNTQNNMHGRRGWFEDVRKRSGGWRRELKFVLNDAVSSPDYTASDDRINWKGYGRNRL